MTSQVCEDVDEECRGIWSPFREEDWAWVKAHTWCWMWLFSFQFLVLINVIFSLSSWSNLTYVWVSSKLVLMPSFLAKGKSFSVSCLWVEGCINVPSILYLPFPGQLRLCSSYQKWGGKQFWPIGLGFCPCVCLQYYRQWCYWHHRIDRLDNNLPKCPCPNLSNLWLVNYMVNELYQWD